MSDRRSAERGVQIPDDFVGIYYVEQVGTNPPTRSSNNTIRRTGKPLGIIFDENRDDPDQPRAAICGILWDESENEFKTRKLAPGVEHPRAYKAIDMDRTNARGIEINW